MEELDELLDLVQEVAQKHEGATQLVISHFDAAFAKSTTTEGGFDKGGSTETTFVTTTLPKHASIESDAESKSSKVSKGINKSINPNANMAKTDVKRSSLEPESRSEGSAVGNTAPSTPQAKEAKLVDTPASIKRLEKELEARRKALEGQLTSVTPKKERGVGKK